MATQGLSERTMQALIDHLQDAVFAIQDGRFVFANLQMTRLLGYPHEQLIGREVFEFIHAEDREMVRTRYGERKSGKQVVDEYQFRILRADGEIRDVNMRVGLEIDDAGPVTTIGSLHDITDRKRTARALAHSQADIESILHNIPDVFYRTDMNGVITVMSPSCREVLGYADAEMLGRPLADFYCDPDDRAKIIDALVAGNGRARQVEACLRHRDGSPVWISTNAYSRMDNNGHPVAIEGIARDITERKRLEEQLENLARFDDLTRFHTRRQFFVEAQDALAHAKGRPLSVVMLDLDLFKEVNDRYGHHAGDRVLGHFADRCRTLLRADDIVGRLGGEEFAMVMPGIGLDQARAIVEDLRSHLAIAPVRVDGQQITVTFSAGVTSLKDDDGDIETLLRRCDRLLYSAKAAGRNRVAAAS